MRTHLFVLISSILPALMGAATESVSQLYEYLLADYNKLMRPVDNFTETVVVRFKLKLSQLVDVHEKNQIMTTNVWLYHSWTDYKLRWNPDNYGGIKMLYIAADLIWLPDIVLYNNADGNYQVQIMTKAKVSANGTVEWSPPALYKSICQIDVEWFPFDQQTCEMKFGSWTYGGLEVDLQHKDSHIERVETELVFDIDGEHEEKVWIVDEGIDLSDYYPSVEWDILGVPSKRHEKRYPCCISPFIDITYEIKLRRKTLFYTVNLMIPIVGISFLTALVFYLPSRGGERIPLSITIMISLTVFFLLLVEIIPSTSLVIPLIGKYLLFTMVLTTLSVIFTVITVNVNYRGPATHTLPHWVRRIFIDILPQFLFMHRPIPPLSHIGFGIRKGCEGSKTQGFSNRAERQPSRLGLSRETRISALFEQIEHILQYHRSFVSSMDSSQKEFTPLGSAGDSVTFIAEQMRKTDNDLQVVEDWKYISVVIDRIFLIMFTTACMLGMFCIILRAPTIYDTSLALA